MADDEDQSSKTEDPTSRKLDKLKEDGNVPTSREVNHVFALIGILMVVGLAGPYTMKSLGDLFISIIANAGSIRLEERSSIGVVLFHSGLSTIIALMPILLVMLVLGYVGGIIQNGPVFSSKPITPNLEKISIVAGFKRLFSLKSLAEFLKSLAKFVVIGIALALVVKADLPHIYSLAQTGVGSALMATKNLLLVLVGVALLLMVFLAGADLIFQRMQFTKQHMMSRRELKDEVKETEGDPYVKQRQRQIRADRARQRMMSSVPEADVVVTNPTHYAVALRYKPDDGDAAPTVVAKGTDLMALRIREVATEHNVPLYEDPPLARQLYAEVDIDEPIPLQLYEVVAKVISFVHELKARKNR